ncbi:MAG: hypothetical protein RIC06_00855 [Cyclobacteriaceae bacterium]
MKNLIILSIGILCWLPAIVSNAKIKNGYTHQLEMAQSTLWELSKMAKALPDIAKTEKVCATIEKVQLQVDELKYYFDRTQELIDLVEKIDPVLFDEMNRIADQMGNETDIYIKVVAKIRYGFLGAMGLKQSETNPHIYQSEFGNGTLSIWIKHISLKKNLWPLIHEFGHVRYVVPHLAEYAPFYKKHYQDQQFSGIPGHHLRDPSLAYVYKTMREFRRSWKEFKNKTTFESDNNQIASVE